MNLLFFKDLLDGVNGMILDHKDRQDCHHRINSVESWHKITTTIFLFLISLGMLFYIFLFAMRQSQNRQAAWFNSFLVWLFFEICISSTGVVLLEHVLIPLWSLKDIQRVKEKIVSDILIYQRRLQYAKQRAQQQQQQGITAAGAGMKSYARVGTTSTTRRGGGGQEQVGLVGLRSAEEVSTDLMNLNPDGTSSCSPFSSPSLSFNAAEHLYPSFRIAQLFPTLPESQLILQYRTPWPKISLQGRDKSVKENYDKRFEFLTRTLSRVLVFTLSSLIQLPQPLQDSALQIFVIGFFGFVIRFHLRLYEINPFLVILPLFVIGLCVHLMTTSSNQRNRTLIFNQRSSSSVGCPLSPAAPGVNSPDDRIFPQLNAPAASSTIAGTESSADANSPNPTAAAISSHDDFEVNVDAYGDDGECVWESSEDEDDRNSSSHNSSSTSSFQSPSLKSNETRAFRVLSSGRRIMKVWGMSFSISALSTVRSNSLRSGHLPPLSLFRAPSPPLFYLPPSPSPPSS
jgi:hypothetical protein